jgi:hypothetical protein
MVITRDGYYYGYIALTQTVMEMMICQMWRVEPGKGRSQEADFKKHLEALHKKGFITDAWKIKLDHIWAKRHAFHHLSYSIQTDRQRLEEAARNHLCLLNALNQEFFGY